MLSSRNKAPVGLGQQAHLPLICLNRSHSFTSNRKQCIVRAAEHRLESLLAGTAVAVLVEVSLPLHLSYLGLAPEAAASTEAVTVLETVDARGGDATRGASPQSIASAPEVAAAASTQDSASRGGDREGFLSRFSRKQKANEIRAPEASQPAAVVPAADTAQGTRAAESELETNTTNLIASRGDDSAEGTAAAASIGTNGYAGSSLMTWALERATLLAAGGLAGVAVFRGLASPANRAVDVDAVTAALRSAKSASAGAAPPKASAASAAHRDEELEASVPRVPYGVTKEYPRPGSAAGRRSPAMQRPPSPPSAAPGAPSSRMPRPGQGPAQAGKGSWPTASSAGVNSGPIPSPPPYADVAVDYPPPGPFYGPLPPPWWREQYAEYDRYGVTYGPPPVPFRGPVWEEPAADSDETTSGPASTPQQQDPYYYYYGALGGYWGWDASRRWVPRAPYDAYDGPYHGYDPSAPPQPSAPAPLAPPPPPAQPRGYSGMQASPGPGMGRNPWAAVERAELEQDAGSVVPKPLAGRASPAPSPSPQLSSPPEARRNILAARSVAAGTPSSASAPENELEGVDDALSQLQAQLQGHSNVAPVASASVAAGDAVATRPENQESGQKSKAPRRPASAGWRQRLQQEVEEQQIQSQQQQQEKGEQPGQRRESEGRGSAGVLKGGLEGRERKQEQQQNERLYTPSVSVSPAADQEYERLMQMWREVHPESDDHAEAYSSSKRTGTEAAAVVGMEGEPTSDTPDLQRRQQQQQQQNQAQQKQVERQQEQQQDHEQQVDRQGPQPAISSASSQPQPPPVVTAPSKEADSHQQESARQPEAVVAAILSTQKTSSTESSGGPIGWFARMFKGLTGGGRTKQDPAVQQPQLEAGQTLQPGAEHLDRQLEQQALVRNDEKQDAELSEASVTTQHLKELPQNPKADAQAQQQEEQKQQQQQKQKVQQQDQQEIQENESDRDKVEAGVEQRQRRQGAQSEEVAGPMQASASLAAAVEAALQGQLAEQQHQQQSENGAAAGATIAGRRTAAAGPSQARSTTTATGPSLRAGTGPSPNKESIQQLKATSAAAADRAAETLARIRAMRAAAQAAGTRSGSGGRSYSANGSGNGTALADAGKVTSSRNDNVNGSGVAVPQETGDRVGQAGKPAADGAGPVQGVESNTIPVT